jgi:thioredoxin-related protein
MPNSSYLFSNLPLIAQRRHTVDTTIAKSQTKRLILVFHRLNCHLCYLLHRERKSFLLLMAKVMEKLLLMARAKVRHCAKVRF